jgi:hypothetical protein
MRPISGPMYGIPPERVVGSTLSLVYRDGDVYTTAELQFVDDGPTKPVRLFERIGRRPVFAAGNSNGDIEMLEFSASSDRPSMQVLILHDDADREFDYTAGAETALTRAADDGWVVASIKNDWTTVFGA